MSWVLQVEEDFFFFPERSWGEQPRQMDQHAQKHSGVVSVAYAENCMGQILKGLVHMLRKLGSLLNPICNRATWRAFKEMSEPEQMCASESPLSSESQAS